MKYLITGANGMLGSALCPLLRSEGDETYAVDVNIGDSNKHIYYLDVTDKPQVYAVVGEVKPDFIFHLAAETNVDRCELDPEHAYRVNVLGTENLASLCKQCDIPLVYISTCGVFDGKKDGPYTEFDKPHPVSVYTRTKLEGEKAVESLLKKYFIFRAGWMMGGGRRDKKFVAKIVKLLNTKDKISVVNDKFGSPTYTVDMSKAMLAIIKLQRYGLYHVTNRGFCSRYDLACKIRKYIKKDNVTIMPVSSSEFTLPAPRPRSEATESIKLKSLCLDNILRPWQEALEDYLQQLINKR